MPEIKPFFGIRYNPGKVPDLASVTTQPYDQISESMEQEYKKASPYNYVRLILTKESAGHDRKKEYQDAKNFGAAWLKEGIFMKDDKPSIYPYRQTFIIDKKQYQRTALIALLKLEELGKGNILPHERTLSKPKADRLNLMRITQKNLEYVFLLYTDLKQEVIQLAELETKNPPVMDFQDRNKIKHQVWRVADPQQINKAQSILKNSIMVIADGHHRYETSFSYAAERASQNSKHTGNEPYNYRLVALVNIEDPGLVILPTHRLIKNINNFDLSQFLKTVEQYFNVKKSNEKEIARELEIAKEKAFGFYSTNVSRRDQPGAYLLKLKDTGALTKMLPGRTDDYRSLDVVILHTVLIESLLGIKPEEIENHVKYERGIDKTIEHVKKGEFQFCFLMNPTKPGQVKAVAEQRDRMPQKSTDFFPKMLSGLVFFDMADQKV